MNHRCRFFGALLLFSCVLLHADQEASNIPYVKSGSWGRCYVKAVPDGYYDTKGKTFVYVVRKDADLLVHTFPWYSQQVHLQGNMVGAQGYHEGSGVSLVRMGAWSRRDRPSREELALAFYYNGRLLAAYSTLDIAGKTMAHSRSVSHIRVIREVKGYRWVTGNSWAFDIVTVDGRTLSFNPVTGRKL